MTSTHFKVGSKSFADEAAVLAEVRDLAAPLPADQSPIFFSRKEHTAAFWNDAQGQAFSGEHFAKPFVSISQSGPARFLSELKDQNEISREFEGVLDREISRLYAEKAEGAVFAFVFEANDRPFISWVHNPQIVASLKREGATLEEIAKTRGGDIPTAFGFSSETQSSSSFDPTSLIRNAQKWDPNSSIWFDVELPSLLNNPKVTSINGIPRDKLFEHWKTNGFSTSSLVRVSKDIADGIFSVPQQMAPRGSGNSPPSGTPLHKLGPGSSVQFTSPIQTQMEVAGTSANTSQSAELFRAHETLPGGIVFSRALSTDLKVTSIAIDPRSEGAVIVNKSLTLQTGMSFEEIALILASFAHSTPLGATSIRNASATKAEDMIGTVFRIADKVFGDYVYKGKPLCGFDDAYSHPSSDDEVELIEKLDREFIANELDSYYGNSSATIVTEFTKVGFTVRRDRLDVAQLDVNLHGCLFTGTPDQPGLDGGAEAFELRYPQAAARLRSLTEHKLLQSNPIFQKIGEYAALSALVRSCAQNAPNMTRSSKDLAAFLVAESAAHPLRALNERTVFDDSAMFGCDETSKDKARATFFNVLERIKAETVPDTFGTLVAAAHLLAHRSDIPYLHKSLAFEVRSRIDNLIPTTTSDLRTRQFQKLCARIASEELFNPLRGRAELKGVTSAHTEYDALSRALVSEAKGHFDAAVDYLANAAEFLSEGRDSTNAIALSGDIGGLTNRLCARGYGTRLAAKLASAIGASCGDKPELTAFVGWEYAAALGFVVSDLIRKHIPLEHLVDSIKQHLSDSSEASVATALILRVTSRFQTIGSEERDNSELASTLCLSYRDLNQNSLSACDRMANRCAALCEIFVDRPMSMVVTTHPAGWLSDGMVGVDRLKIEFEFGTPDPSLLDAYRNMIETLTDGVKATKSQDVATIVGTLASQLYARDLGFAIGRVDLLSDALREKVLDCDTSAFIFRDVLCRMGLKCMFVHTPGHLLLQVGDGVFIETAQGEILGERALKSKYGTFVYVGDDIRYGAAISYASVGVAQKDRASRLRAFHKAKDFTPADPLVLCNIAITQFDDNATFDSTCLATFSKEVDDGRKRDPFNPALLVARGVLDKHLTTSTLDILVAEFNPSLTVDTEYKSKSLKQDTQGSFEAGIVGNLILLRRALHSSVTEAFKSNDIGELSRSVGTTRSAMTIDESGDTLMQRHYELLRFGMGNHVFLHADLAVDSVHRKGTELDGVTLYSIALWENSECKLPLLRRVKAKGERGDLIGREADYQELSRIDPNNAEFNYHLGVIALVKGDYQTALVNFEQARPAFKSEFIDDKIRQTYAARAQGATFPFAVNAIYGSLRGGHTQAARDVVRYFLEKHPQARSTFEELKGFIDKIDADGRSGRDALQGVSQSSPLLGIMKKFQATDTKEAIKFFDKFYADKRISNDAKVLHLPEAAAIQRALGNSAGVIEAAERIISEGTTATGTIIAFVEATLSALEVNSHQRVQTYMNQLKNLAEGDGFDRRLRAIVANELSYLQTELAVQSFAVTGGGAFDEIQRVKHFVFTAPNSFRTRKLLQTVAALQQGLLGKLASMYGSAA